VIEPVKNPHKTLLAPIKNQNTLNPIKIIAVVVHCHALVGGYNAQLYKSYKSAHKGDGLKRHICA
jgi:hypothetical protein